MKGWSTQRVGELYQANRALVWLTVVVFVNQLGFGSIIPVIALYAQEFGVPQSAIGLTIAVYGFARFVASVPTGQLADRIGRRPTLVLGGVVSALGNLLCGLSTTYEQFLIFRFISGAGASIVLTAGQISLADLSTRANRGRNLGMYHGMFMFAVGIGPLPGGFLAEWFGLNVPFFAYAVACALVSMLAFDRVPETRGMRGKGELVAEGSGPFERPPLLMQLRVVFAKPGFLLVSLVNLVSYVARTGAIFAIVPLLAVSKLGLGPDQIGAGLALVSVANLGMVYLSGVLVDRFGRKPVIVPSTLLAGLTMAMFAVVPDYGWFVVALTLWGVASGIGGVAPAAYAADMAPPGMNAVTMSSYRMISELGYIGGPVFLGWVSDVSSPETSLYTTAAMFAVACLLFALWAPETGMAGRKPGLRTQSL